MESLTQSVNRLLSLGFLPSFQGLKSSYKLDDLEKFALDFPRMDETLQEATFDCVIAISKITMHLKNAICAENPSIMYEKGAKAQRIRDEMKARRDYQEYLTRYLDVLCSMRADNRMARFAEQLN